MTGDGGRRGDDARTQAAPAEVCPGPEGDPNVGSLQKEIELLRARLAHFEQCHAAQAEELVRAREELERQTDETRRAEEALRRNEDHLRQTQKLEAVGRLAGGIAHDFNNLLSVVLSYTELLLADADEQSLMAADLREIREAGVRAAGLTRQLLAFSRQQVLALKVLDLNKLLADFAKMLTRVLGEDIELLMSLGGGLANIKADPGQIEQVIMNLVLNARDAMPDGGKLLVETTNVYLDELYARGHLDVTPGPYVMLAVTDTGVGIDREMQGRVFDPFFTTKEPGKGTGLGLATVFGIIKQSGGHVWFYSEPPRGTTFKVYLPAAVGAAEGPLAVRATSKKTRGDETILLVEDEEKMRAVASHILKNAGYQVIEAREPEEALLVCEQHPANIDLLLTDVIMPTMNGRQLADHVGAIRPGIRVIFMSGYTGMAIVDQGVLEAGAHFLQKPITPEPLTRKVRQVLDAK